MLIDQLAQRMSPTVTGIGRPVIWPSDVGLIDALLNSMDQKPRAISTRGWCLAGLPYRHCHCNTELNNVTYCLAHLSRPTNRRSLMLFRRFVVAHAHCFIIELFWSLTKLRSGALKMLHVKLQDVKQTDEIAGHENAKHEHLLAYIT